MFIKTNSLFQLQSYLQESKVKYFESDYPKGRNIWRGHSRYNTKIHKTSLNVNWTLKSRS